MWEQGSRTDLKLEQESRGNSSLPFGRFSNPRAGGWRALAAVAAGLLLGVPLLGTGTARAAWAEVSQFLATWRSWYGGN